MKLHKKGQEHGFLFWVVLGVIISAVILGAAILILPQIEESILTWYQNLKASKWWLRIF